MYVINESFLDIAVLNIVYQSGWLFFFNSISNLFGLFKVGVSFYILKAILLFLAITANNNL